MEYHFDNFSFLLTIMLNRTLLFIAIFLIWRVSSEFFLQIGVPLLVIGITFSLFQGLGFFTSWNIDKLFPQISITKRINFLNILCFLAISVFFINSVTLKNTWIFLSAYVIATAAELTRWPLYSQLINGVSNSYNRATVLSMSNVLKSMLDIPLLFLSALLISMSYPAFFCLAMFIALIATFVFFLRPAD